MTFDYDFTPLPTRLTIYPSPNDPTVCMNVCARWWLWSFINEWRSGADWVCQSLVMDRVQAQTLLPLPHSVVHQQEGDGVWPGAHRVTRLNKWWWSWIVRFLLGIDGINMLWTRINIADGYFCALGLRYWRGLFKRKKTHFLSSER